MPLSVGIPSSFIGIKHIDITWAEILSIHKVKKSKDNEFIADAEWNVRKSVSHFGHTHCRRNQYHALAACVMDSDFWKIKNIELMAEQRHFNGDYVDFLPEVTLRR